MKHALRLVFLVTAAVFLGGAIGCQRPAPAATGKTEKAAIRVTTTKPKLGTLIRTTAQPARIEAYEQTPLFARLEGYMRDPKVDIGDEVKKDQPLAELWVPDKIAELHQKEAHFEQAKAEVKQAQHNIVVKQKAAVSAKARISEADSAVVRVDGDFKRWQAEYDRIQLLVKSGSLSQKLVEEAENQLRSAEASQKEMAAKVRSAEAGFGESEAEIEKARADHAAALAKQNVAAAEVEGIKAMLQYTTICAPFAGVVTQRNVHTGHLVQPGGRGEPLFVVAQMDKVRIIADVPESEASLVNAGDPVTIVIPALSAAPIQIKETSGANKPRITRTSWSLQTAARTLQTEVHLDNPDGRLRPGMYGVMTITCEERPGVLSLPIAAVVTREGRTCCCCVEKKHVVFKPVTLGLRAGNEVEIASGLSPDDAVIVANAAQFEPGQAVTIANEAAR